MLDLSFAAGLEPMRSSFSSMVFSEATIRRVAMMALVRWWQWGMDGFGLGIETGLNGGTWEKLPAWLPDTYE